MQVVTEITIKLVEEIDENEANIVRQHFENGDIMEMRRVDIIEEVVSLISLSGEKDVHVSFNLLDDEEDEEDE